MTKQEALQKIEELRKFVDELDKQELVHGNLVYLKGYPDSKRIVIDTRELRQYSSRFLVIDETGRVHNWFNNAEDINIHYSTICNVFRG